MTYKKDEQAKHTRSEPARSGVMSAIIIGILLVTLGIWYFMANMDTTNLTTTPSSTGDVEIIDSTDKLLQTVTLITDSDTINSSGIELLEMVSEGTKTSTYTIYTHIIWDSVTNEAATLKSMDSDPTTVLDAILVFYPPGTKFEIIHSTGSDYQVIADTTVWKAKQ